MPDVRFRPNPNDERSNNGSSVGRSTVCHKLRIAAPSSGAQGQHMETDRETRALISSLPWRGIRFAGLVVLAAFCAWICVAGFLERHEAWLPWQFPLLVAFALLLGYTLLAYVIVPLAVELIVGLIRRIPP
jgi:hypothetical protein